MAPARSSRWPWVLAAVFLAAQIVTDASHGLSVDEAHYALYGYFPDWSYFDHPPLVGWLQMPAVWLGGSDFLLRLVPLACWILALLLVRKLAVELFAGPDAPAAAGASLLLAATVPMFQLIGMSLHPDTLLLPITAAVMLAAWRLRDPDEIGRTAPWLVLGVTVGLAGLAKYTGIFPALSAAGVLLARHGRRLLNRRGPWFAVGLALVMVSPVLGWNASHHWISFQYQGLHAEGGQAWSAGEFVRVQWEQIKIYGPLTFLAFLLALPAVRRAPGAVFCLAFALPPAVVIALLSGRGGSLSYWSASAWLAALPLAGWGLARSWRAACARRWLAIVWAILLAWVGAIQLLFCLVGFARIWDGGPPEGSAVTLNPFADLYGWDRAASRARELALARGLRSVSVMNWTLASRIAWYSRPFFVYVLDPRFDQIDMWYGKLPVGGSTILIRWSRLPYPMPVRPEAPRGFAQAEFLEEMPVIHNGKVLSRFDFYYCRDWGGASIAAPMPIHWISAF